MQLKGMVKFFTAALILFSLWRLSFTFIAQNVEKKIEAKAQSEVSALHPEAEGSGKEALIDKSYSRIADSLGGETVFNFLGAKYTYQEVKDKQLQLGLDLQGGMAVTLEVGLHELIESMSNNPKDPGLQRALEEAQKARAGTSENFVSLFGKAYERINPNGKLALLFTKASQPNIRSNSTNKEVLDVISREARAAVTRTYNVLSSRIDKFGVSQPNINLDQEKGIITVELAGVKDPESVRRQLQSTAKLEFWEVATNLEMAGYLMKANEVLGKYLEGGSSPSGDTAISPAADTAALAATEADNAQAAADSGSLASLLGGEASPQGEGDLAATQRSQDLFSIMMPMVDQSSGQFQDATIIGAVQKRQAEQLLEYLNMDIVKNQFPRNIKFLLGEFPGLSASEKNNPNAPLGVYAIKTVRGTDEAKLEGDRVKSARFDYQQTGRAEISLEMDQQGSALWAKLTRENIGKPIAIVLDDYVYSAPVVQNEITGGRSSITGSFTAKEGTELANILETGKLPAPAKIVQEQVVGPTLGAESIKGGVTSFVIAFGVIFILMLVYYNTGGLVANVALLLNLLFTFGILSNLGATLSMAGIAGIVLGIGMAVDSNVVIFERIKDELGLGDTYADAIKKGYQRSYAPVLDGHITSLITAVILYIYGLGPVKGFATTQIISLILSMFTGILVSRLITEIYMKKGRHFKYFTSVSKSIFQKAKFHFVEKRKITYVISALIFALGIASFFNGFDYGVEFDGGRSYTIQLDREVPVGEIRETLQKHLDKYPVVKTVGVQNQISLTTDYLIEQNDRETEEKVLAAVFAGMKAGNFIPADVDLSTFSSSYVQSTQTVLPTISEDLKKGAIQAAVLASLAIFVYIFVRFRKWQYSVGTILSMIHDAAVVLIVFSFFKSFMPFALEIDQHFIAALLTVIGFSINDTVIVFDRIRENFRKTPDGNKSEVINLAINQTLSRTVMTSATVFLTAVILFIFGGEVLRGFAFAMAVGVLAGTYSSIFLASPILVDLDKKNKLRLEEDKEARIAKLKEQA